MNNLVTALFVLCWGAVAFVMLQGIAGAVFAKLLQELPSSDAAQESSALPERDDAPEPVEERKRIEVPEPVDEPEPGEEPILVAKASASPNMQEFTAEPEVSPVQNFVEESESNVEMRGVDMKNTNGANFVAEARSLIRTRPLAASVVALILLAFALNIVMIVINIVLYQRLDAVQSEVAAAVASPNGPMTANTFTAPGTNPNAFNFGNSASGNHMTSIGGGSPHLVSSIPGTTLIVSAIGLKDMLTVDASGNLGVQGAIVPGGGQGTPAAGFFGGTGAPRFVAPNGSVYLRYDGANGTHLYVNSSGPSRSGKSWRALPSL